MPGIFISYRRSDNPDATGRIYDRLVSEFGKARVFKDVDSIPLGQDFRGHLNGVVGDCAVMLAIIGPRWTDARNGVGQRRLEDAEDFVRIELEAALAREIPVVPVLVAHAAMPGTSDLPASLASMVFRQSIEVRPDPDFHHDSARLVAALRQILDPNAPITESLPGMHTDPGGAPALARRPDRRLAWVGTLAVTAIVVAAALAIPAVRYLREVPAPETRIAITLPVQDGPLAFALSPDGRQIVYQASGDSDRRLWLRTLSTTTAQPVPGTEGAVNPFWSPDGRSIGFFAAGSLKRIDLGVGQPQNLAPVNGGPIAPFGVWSVNGDLLFSSGLGQSIARIAATGGPVTAVTKSDSKNIAQLPGSILPDGQHFLLLVVGSQSDGIYLGMLDGSPPVRLTTDYGGRATYLPSGWMLWMRDDGPVPTRSGSLLAQRLDLRNAKLTGAPVLIAGEVGAFSAAATGLIAHTTVSAAGQRQLTWVDRSGMELGTIGDADETLSAPRVAPDGRRIVVSRVAQGNRDLWLLDGARASRLTFNAAEDEFPVWSPDGLRITFGSNRSGNFALYQKLASGAGEEEAIQTTDQFALASSWSPDGRYLMYFANEVMSDKTVSPPGIWVLPTYGDRKPSRFLETQSAELWGQFSPDGRWVAYESDESGHMEVFVRPFHPPGTAGETGASAAANQWMVSTEGGISPMWSANGKELYYLNPAGEMMAAPITITGSAAQPGTPIRLFAAHIWGGGFDAKTGRQYDVAPDGRFLINRLRAMDATPTITLLQNWNPAATRQ